MTSFADLEQLSYFGEEAARSLRAVGWLESGDAYASGPADRIVFDRLCELLHDAFQPVAFAGTHACTLCRFRPEAQGSRNLFVPGDNFLYVCPELILHYMNVHAYRPPENFCAAVVACPNTRSTEYRRLFLACGGGMLVRG